MSNRKNQRPVCAATSGGLEFPTSPRQRTLLTLDVHARFARDSSTFQRAPAQGSGRHSATTAGAGHTPQDGVWEDPPGVTWADIFADHSHLLGTIPAFERLILAIHTCRIPLTLFWKGLAEGFGRDQMFPLQALRTTRLFLWVVPTTGRSTSCLWYAYPQ